MSLTKEMKNPNDSTIILDKQKIYDAINSGKNYNNEGIIMRKWAGVEDAESYCGQIEKDGVKFIGIFNGNFEREGYGINYYNSGDIYFGYFENDQRNKHGIYLWPKENKGNKVKREMYYGYWKEDKKDRNGLYLWLEEPDDNNNFDNANFDCYIGQMSNDSYKRGTYLSKKEDSYYLYHGNFNRDGKKNDNSGFFYSSTLDRLLKGIVVDDAFTEGYVSFFNSETGDLNDMMFCKFTAQGEVEETVMREEIEESQRNEIEEEMGMFRNIILQEDYFGNIYKSYKDILKFIEDNMKNLEVMDNEEKFPEVMKMCIGYTSLNLFHEIEKNALKKK